MAISLADLSTEPEANPPRIVIYGPDKIGKTTWCASAPNPVFIRTEDGVMKNISVPGGPALKPAFFPVAKTLSEFNEMLSALYREDHNHKTVVIDSLTWLEPLIHAEICARNKVSDLEDIGFGKGYKMALNLWRDAFEACDMLRRDRGMATIMICHSDVKKYEAPDNDPYDRFIMKIHKDAADMAAQWCDCLFYVGYLASVVKNDIGFKKEAVRAVGTGMRQLYTEERPAFRAGNRFGLPPELQFTWSAFWSAYTGQPVAPAVEPKANSKAK